MWRQFVLVLGRNVLVGSPGRGISGGFWGVLFRVPDVVVLFALGPSRGSVGGSG